MALQRGYELLGLALLGLLMHSPAAAANTAPVCADVSATVQNVDAESHSNGARPVDRDRGGVHRSGPGTTLQYLLNGPPPLGRWGGDPAAFVYSPKYLFRGTDTFDYVASDGIDVSHGATVTITVLAPRSSTRIQTETACWIPTRSARIWPAPAGPTAARP